jgi:hypothetical protein
MSPAADSAGQPFAGRSFSPNPFAGDNGERSPALAEALEDFGTVIQTPSDVRSSAELGVAWVAVVDALRTSRLLTPLIAEAGDFGVTDSGAVVEKTQELSVVHVKGPDGRPVSPVFSDVASLSKWNARARPVPVEGQRAALAAAADGLDLMVLDPTTPHSVVFRRSALKALATGEAYIPPWRDASVQEQISLGLELAGGLVVKHKVIAGDPSQTLSGPEVLVAVGVLPGVDPDELRDALARVSQAWSDNALVVASCDGIGIKVLPA